MAKSTYPGLTLPFFRTGLYTYRSQLFAPLKSVGINVVQMRDALIDGQDMEVTDKLEITRRPGFSRICSVQLSNGEIINQFYSDRAIVNGVPTLFSFFDSNQRFAFFSASAITTIWNKASASQAFIETVGSQLYICNGTANGQKRYNTLDGTLHTMGIAGPAAAPVVGVNTQGATFWQPNSLVGVSHIFVLMDSNGNLQFSPTSYNTGPQTPAWSPFVGAITKEFGTAATWINCGPPQSWLPNTAYVIPTPGAGPIVIDSNGNLQKLTTAGTSGASSPIWASTVGSTTTDNTAVWTCVSSIGPQTVFTGYTYVYVYSTQAPTVASGYYHCSTASPETFTTGPVVGSYNQTISGLFSTNPDVGSVDIYRTQDGGSILFYLGSVANNVAGGPWSFTDNILDLNLNKSLLMPLGGNHQNDVPPGTTGSVAPSADQLGQLSFWNGRLWGCAGYKVYFDAGGDCQNGDPRASWPPANVFAFNGPTVCTTPTSKGLLVWLPDALKIILGGPSTLSYWADDLMENFGVSSPNCVYKDGDEIHVLTTQGQYWVLTVTDKVERSRMVADLVANTFAPVSSYVTAHHNGIDAADFIADGSANILRYGVNIDSWSPLYKPVGGVKAVKSIETSVGVYTLCAGRASAAGFILGRNMNSWQDDGQNYSNCFVTIGNLVLSQPREPLVPVHWVSMLLNGGGNVPTVEVLPNEVSGLSGVLPNVWNPATSYTIGKQVQFNQMVFTATHNSTNQQPSTTSTFWVFTAWAITFIAVPSPVPTVGMRAPLSLTELNWSLFNLQTLRESLMMHHLQVKVTFPPANFPDTIKQLSLGPNEG